MCAYCDGTANRKVTVVGTNQRVTFTQRGAEWSRGFVRINGKTISGVVDKVGGTVFSPNPIRLGSR